MADNFRIKHQKAIQEAAQSDTTLIEDDDSIEYLDSRLWKYSDVSYWINPDDGCCNATIKYKDKKTRLRASLLIFNKDSVLLCKDPENPENFSLPGGGLDENETVIEAAIREAKEEVGIVATNVVDTGFDYCECHEELKDWVAENVPKKQQWYNYYTCLVMADFAADYTGKIDKVDQDPEMKNTAAWYKIKDILLDPTVNPQWKKAIKLHKAAEVNEDIKKDAFSLNIISPKELKEDYSKDTNLKLKIDGKVVGKAMIRDYQDGEIFLTDFEILPEFRGKGYGKKSFDMLVNKYGVNSLTVNPENSIALNMYKKFGFKQVSEPYWDENSEENVIYMKKDLKEGLLEDPQNAHINNLRKILLEDQITAYHGSPNNFDTFKNDIKYGKPNFVWFAADKALCKDYAEDEDAGYLYTVSLNLHDTLDLTPCVLAGKALTTVDGHVYATKNLTKFIECVPDLTLPRVFSYIKSIVVKKYQISVNEMYLFDLVKIPEIRGLVGEQYASLKCTDLDGHGRKIVTYGIFNPADIQIIEKEKIGEVNEVLQILNQKILVEDTRNQFTAKSRNVDAYKYNVRGKNRWERKKFSKASQATAAYNQLDMDAFFKQDLLEIKIPVVGETDEYIVSIQLDGVCQELANNIKNNNNIFEYKCIIQALTKIFNMTDIRVKCTCADYKYRYAHNLIINNNSVDDTSKDPGPGSTGMTAAMQGKGCKHILMCLNNMDWLMKVGNVIKNYIMYMSEHNQKLFLKFIFPKLYGVPSSAADEANLIDDVTTLDSSKDIIDTINTWARNRGKFKKGEQVNPATGKGKLDNSKGKPDNSTQTADKKQETTKPDATKKSTANNKIGAEDTKK